MIKNWNASGRSTFGGGDPLVDYKLIDLGAGFKEGTLTILTKGVLLMSRKLYIRLQSKAELSHF